MSRTFPLETIKLFYGYAHDDHKLANRLGRALIGLKHENYLETWSEGDILAGSPVGEEIERHISGADILLLLISQEFLASKYCYQTLLQRALQRDRAGQAIAVLVLLRPVDWNEAAFSSLIRLPSTQKPVSQWERLDDAFYDIARGIRALLKKVWLLKGDTYLSEGKLERALYAYDEAIHLDRDFGPAYVAKGKVQRAQDDHDGAKQSFELALKRDPTNANTYCELGVTYYQAGDSPRALSFFDQALQREKLHAPACIYKGLVLQKMGKLREARQVYDDYLKMQPDDALVTPFQTRLVLLLEGHNGDDLQGPAHQAQVQLSSLAERHFDVSSSEVDPIVPFLEGFSRLAETLAFLFSEMERHLGGRMARLERTDSSLARSTAHINTMEESLRRELASFATLEHDLLKRQLAQTEAIFSELRYVASQPISAAGDIAQGLESLLQHLSNSRNEADHALQERLEYLAGRIQLQSVQQTYGVLSFAGTRAGENQESDEALALLPTESPRQTPGSERLEQPSTLNMAQLPQHTFPNWQAEESSSPRIGQGSEASWPQQAVYDVWQPSTQKRGPFSALRAFFRRWRRP